MSGSNSNPSDNKPKDGTATQPSTGTDAATPSNPPEPTKLQEDDEFEDFPADDWPDTEDGAPAHAADGEQGAHLWEESWDDDDTNDDFAKQLQEEMKKVEASKK